MTASAAMMGKMRVATAHKANSIIPIIKTAPQNRTIAAPAPRNTRVATAHRLIAQQHTHMIRGA